MKGVLREDHERSEGKTYEQIIFAKSKETRTMSYGTVRSSHENCD